MCDEHASEARVPERTCVATHQDAGEGKQLALSDGEVVAALRHGPVQALAAAPWRRRGGGGVCGGGGRG